MNYKRTIAASAIAVVGKKYPIYNNHFKIGDAEFLKREGDVFEFDINLANAKETNFEYMCDVDSTTFELVSMRAVPKVKF